MWQTEGDIGGVTGHRKIAFEQTRKILLKSDDEILGGAAVKMNLNLFRYIAADATRCEFEDVKIKLMPGIASLSKRVTISPPYDYQKDHLEICIAMSKMFNGLFFIIPTRGGFVVFEE